MKTKILKDRAEALAALDQMVKTGCDEAARSYIEGMSDEDDDTVYAIMEASENASDGFTKFLYLAGTRELISDEEAVEYIKDYTAAERRREA